MLLLGCLPKIPQCTSCLRRSLNPDTFDLISSFRIQLRGKKKGRKEPATVKARLLKDIRGWGRQGSIVPVPPGRMRNIWYPKGHAEYMTSAQLKRIEDLVIERDPLFGMDLTEKVAVKEEPVVQIELLSPQRSTHLIQTFVPQILPFHRPVIIFNPATLSSSSSSPVPTSTTTTITSTPKLIPIYGSVSTADIAALIHSILRTKALSSEENSDASRVVLSAEDVSILPEGDESVDGDRIKALGDFEVDIQVKGAQSGEGEGKVRRTVRVTPEEEQGRSGSVEDGVEGVGLSV